MEPNQECKNWASQLKIIALWLIKMSLPLPFASLRPLCCSGIMELMLRSAGKTCSHWSPRGSIPLLKRVKAEEYTQTDTKCIELWNMTLSVSTKTEIHSLAYFLKVTWEGAEASREHLPGLLWGEDFVNSKTLEAYNTGPGARFPFNTINTHFASTCHSVAILICVGEGHLVFEPLQTIYMH